MREIFGSAVTYWRSFNWADAALGVAHAITYSANSDGGCMHKA